MELNSQESIGDILEKDELKLTESTNGVRHENEEQSDDDSDEDNDEDEEGWITPDNLQQACEEMGGVLEEEPKGIAVGCITTDFAMQVRYSTSVVLICHAIMCCCQAPHIAQ